MRKLPPTRDDPESGQSGRQDSELLYRTLFDHSPDAIVTVRDGCYVDCNPAALDLFGLSSRDELRRTAVGTLSPPTQPDGRNSITAAREVITESPHKGGIWFDWTFQSRTGREFPARVFLQPVEISGTTLLQMIIRDMTAEKEVLRQLNDQKRMLQQIVDHLPVALYCKDIGNGFRYTLCNRQCEELFGWSGEAVLGHTDFEISSADVALRARDQDLEIAATGKPMEVSDEQIDSPTGGTLIARTVKLAIPDSRGKPAMIVGISENITARREAERALHARERRFQELAEHAPVGIYLTDPRGACIYVNRELEQRTGMGQRESAGFGWLAAVHPDDRQNVLNRWREFVQGDTPFAEEYRFIRPDGNERWIADSAVPFRNEAGQIVGFLGITNDITQRKRSEAELQASRDEAQRANQAKSEFLSRMSHELRTPLNAVLGFGQLLEMNSGNLSESQKEGVEQILASGEHLLQLIDDVLDYSRIDTGHMSLGIRRIDPAESLERALSLIRAMAERNGIEIIAAAESLPGVLADPRRLQQVLVNLLSNAVKYNRQGGSVRVTHELLDDGMIRIAVQDTGPGIRERDQARIFEPFERIIDPRRLVEGTGIGLSICKRLVELMGGRIGFESEFGSGSTFWFDLPAADLDDEEDVDWLYGTLDTMVDLGELEGLRILYIEDHLASIRFMGEIMKRVDGCELLTATNGADGIVLAKSARPDLILMDLNLPGMSGHQALEILQYDERTAGIPVIALSASASTEAVEAAAAAGFAHFIAKPLRLGQLFEVLATVRREAEEFRNTG